jgi:hypothetical protein
VTSMRLRSYLDIAQVWRWRRVRRHGVVLTYPGQPAPLGLAYTWDGRRVGSADRDHLARQLTRAERRRQLAAAARIRDSWPLR